MSIDGKYHYDRFNSVLAILSFLLSGGKMQSSYHRVAKKRKTFVALLLSLCGICVICACLFSIIYSTKDQSNVVAVLEATKTPHPKELPTLIVTSGDLKNHVSEITRTRIINVYKRNRTLDPIDDDLKELCMNYFFYGNRIKKYTQNGDNENTVKARAAFNEINQWLSEYDENDVSVMLELVKSNGWQ